MIFTCFMVHYYRVMGQCTSSTTDRNIVITETNKPTISATLIPISTKRPSLIPPVQAVKLVRTSSRTEKPETPPLSTLFTSLTPTTVINHKPAALIVNVTRPLANAVGHAVTIGGPTPLGILARLPVFADAHNSKLRSRVKNIGQSGTLKRVEWLFEDRSVVL